ncbi:MAG: protein kinase [Deltaproteobacteria bacterium]|nr:protein kinase [Deltaproteobacteria bacterium]
MADPPRTPTLEVEPGALEDALARARPAPSEAGAQRLRMQAVMAAVLGPDVGLPTLGRWIVEAKVRAGGMGVVFRGRDPETREPVAIKLLGAEAAAERPRFSREALILRSIVHPHVVRYLDHGVEGGLDYLVMTWLEGRDLAARLTDAGPLDVRDGLRLALAIAQALGAAHQAGITHRDVKPSNIFLVGDRLDDARLIDFGIAKSTRASHPGTRLTASDAVLGSPHYMAPEQIRGEHDARTDIYGLGATLFECLTGRPPFQGNNPGALLLAVMAEPPPSAAALRPEVPASVDALLGRMLAKDLDDRPRDMTVVATELSALIARPEAAARAHAPLSRSERPRRTATIATPMATPPLVGRARELAEIDGLLAECALEELSSLVLVTGEAGSGKSRLLDALAPASWARCAARGASEEAGEPLATLRALVASRSGGDPQRARMLALLDATSGPDDALVVADRLLLGWLELLEAWSAEGPLLFVVDDLRRVDVTSVRFLDRALGHLAARAFVIVAAARATGDLRGLGTTLPAERRLDVHLGPLRARAALELAGALCGDVRPEVSASVARLSGGTPAHLVELAHQVRLGMTPRDGSLADVLWARLERLDPETRHVLRAASIVGREVWPGAVAALLGVEAGDPRLAARLGSLVAQGHLVRVPGSEALAFASELLQLAAYDLCTEEDLERGHRVVAAWLAAQRRAAGVVVARHLVQAGDPARALPHFVAAARAALAAGQGTRFDALVGEAEACAAAAGDHGAAAAQAVSLAELRVQAAFWRGHIHDALALAAAARDRLAPGDLAWLRMTSLAITAAGQLGDNARVAALADALVVHPVAGDGPGAGEARDARVIGLCRAATQLHVAADGHPLEPILGALDGVDAHVSSAEARAWLGRARATLAGARSFDVAIHGLVEAHRGYVEANDLRSAAQLGIYLASYATWTGAFERAREHVADALHIAERLGADYLVVWARYALGKVETEEAPWSVASALLESVAAHPASSPRIRAGALVYLAIAAARAGHHDLAERHAREALELTRAPMLVRAAQAALARSLLAAGRAPEALALEAALAPLEATTLIAEHDELVMLARAELALAHDEAAGRRALAEAVDRVHARAATLADPLQRNAYLVRPHMVVRTLALAHAMAVPGAPVS